jgi:hypothetical protein
VLPVGVRIDKMTENIFDVSIPSFTSFFREAGAIVNKVAADKKFDQVWIPYFAFFLQRGIGGVECNYLPS